MIEIGLVLIAVLCFTLWRGAVKGRLFVKSVLFLEALDCGDSIEEANRSAATFGNIPDLDNRAIKRADAIRITQFKGKQLPVIEMARARGFIQ